MPLGSSSAAPVMMPGPSLPNRGAPCSRERRLGRFWDGIMGRPMSPLSAGRPLVSWFRSSPYHGYRPLRRTSKPNDTRINRLLVTHVSGSNPSRPAYNAEGGPTEHSMTRYLLSAAVLSGGLLCMDLAAVAQPPTPPPAYTACLRPAQIWDYHPVPGNRANDVTDLARKQYRLTFMGTCRDLQYHIGLRFKTFGVGGLSCVGRSDQIQMHDPVN